jgi:metalloendopeptidase OMA1, mitochondrial
MTGATIQQSIEESLQYPLFRRAGTTAWSFSARATTSTLLRLVLRLTCLAVLALWSAGCTTIPITGRQVFRALPDELTDGMGVQAYAEMKTSTPVSTSRLDSSVVEQVAMRVAKTSEEKFQWEVTLFDEPQTVNAFCMPGGKMGVYTGILPVAQTEAGLAAIMGHEVAHAVARHGSERMAQELLVNLGLTAAAISLGNSQHRGLILQALGLGAKLGGTLPFSRLHESEADHMGLVYMARAGYDPREAVELWKRMAQKGGHVPGLLSLLSTHPDPLDRAKQLEKLLPTVLPIYEQSEKQVARLLPQVKQQSIATNGGAPPPTGMAFDGGSGVGVPPAKKASVKKQPQQPTPKRGKRP